MKFNYFVIIILAVCIILIHINSYTFPHSVVIRHIILILFVAFASYAAYESRRRQLAELEKLKNFLKVCAWCRKICVTDTVTKEDKWILFEEYMVLEHKLKSSHGICPDCYEKESFTD